MPRPVGKTIIELTPMEVLMVVYVTLLIPSFIGSIIGIYFDLDYMWTTIAIPPVALVTVLVGVFVWFKQSKLAYLLWILLFGLISAGLFTLSTTWPEPLFIAAIVHAVITAMVLAAAISHIPHWIRVYRGTD